jgi:hypothetical protein
MANMSLSSSDTCVFRKMGMETYGALDGVFLGLAGLLARPGLLAGAGDFALTGAGDLPPRTREVDSLGALGEGVFCARGLL